MFKDGTVARFGAQATCIESLQGRQMKTYSVSDQTQRQLEFKSAFNPSIRTHYAVRKVAARGNKAYATILFLLPNVQPGPGAYL